MASSQTGLPDFTPSQSLTTFDSTIGNSPIAGMNYNVQLILKNLGTTSGTSSGRLYMNGALVLNASTLTMNPGDTIQTSYSWKPTIGTYTFKWVADEENAITESDETNNVVSKTVTVSGSPSYSLSASSASVNEGSSATFTLTTTNVASGTSVPYTLSGISSADVSAGSLSGNAVVNSSGIATISVALLSDLLT
jgi:subtilase family serine protease